MLRPLLVLLLLTTSCSVTSLFGVPLRCDDDDSCPDDESCENGVCVVVSSGGEGEGVVVGEGEGEGEFVGEGEGEVVVGGEGEGEGEFVGEGEGEVPNFCGDHVAGGAEECDDGDNVNGNGCDNNCTVTRCGNGVITDAEECDDGNVDNDDFCLNSCVLALCGDGVIQRGVEVCDDGNRNNFDLCPNDCGLCGNGTDDNGEECDDGNRQQGDGCDPNCTASRCGNAIVANDEQCDDGDLVDGDGCDSNCTFTGCGNGIQTVGEACDDGAADSLACTESCAVCAANDHDDFTRLRDLFEQKNTPAGTSIAELGSVVRLVVDGGADRVVSIGRNSNDDFTPSRVDLEVAIPALTGSQEVTLRFDASNDTRAIELVFTSTQVQFVSLLGSLVLRTRSAPLSAAVSAVSFEFESVPTATVATSGGSIALALDAFDLSTGDNAKFFVESGCSSASQCAGFNVDVDDYLAFSGCAFQ